VGVLAMEHLHRGALAQTEKCRCTLARHVMRSSTVRVQLGWGLTTLVLAIAGLAWADDPKQEAKARYTTAQSHYNLNEFQEALQDFKEAYRLFPDPVFLFNVAQCERQLGNPDEAIKFYRSYLRNKPKAPNRQEVARRIDEMQTAIDAKNAAAEKPSVNLAPPAAGEEPHAPAWVPSVTATPPHAPNTLQTVTTPVPPPAAASTPFLPVLPRDGSTRYQRPLADRWQWRSAEPNLVANSRSCAGLLPTLVVLGGCRCGGGRRGARRVRHYFARWERSAQRQVGHATCILAFA
jgi:tetratricopeptide (TPR) repeat protein